MEGQAIELVDMSNVEEALERFSTEDRAVFQEASKTLQFSGVGAPQDIQIGRFVNDYNALNQNNLPDNAIDNKAVEAGKKAEEENLNLPELRTR